MGWSATAAACGIMDRLYDYCYNRGGKGTNNGWLYNGREYFVEIGKEHHDGHISGAIWRILGTGYCRRAGSIYINPDGTIRRMPEYLRMAIEA